MEKDEGEGELGENLVFTSHQLIFRSRLLPLSAELLGEQGGVGSCCHSTGGVGSCSWRSEESFCHIWW